MQISELNLSTRQVRAFLALAEQKNFTRAAQQCHLSQSAFSTLIRTLEDAIGVRLFDRDTRNVELTAEDRLFQGGAVRLMEDLRTSLQDLGEHAARRRGRVSVAALPSLAAGWMPDVLAKFREAYPGIELDVADVLSDSCATTCARARPISHWRRRDPAPPNCRPSCSARTASTWSAARTTPCRAGGS